MKNIFLFTHILILLFPLIIKAENISINSPSTNEVLFLNKTHTISWSGGPEKIDIILFNCPWPWDGPVLDCSYASKIAENIDNKHQFEWNITNTYGTYYIGYTRPVKKIQIFKAGEYTITSSLVTIPRDNSFIITDKPELRFNFGGSTETIYTTDFPLENSVEAL